MLKLNNSCCGFAGYTLAVNPVNPVSNSSPLTRAAHLALKFLSLTRNRVFPSCRDVAIHLRDPLRERAYGGGGLSAL